MFPIDNWWDTDLAGISTADIESYFQDVGFDYKAPSDPKVVADVTAARDAAKAAGNTKFENVLNKVLLYGDKALTILTKNGIIENKNLTASGYSAATLAAIAAGSKTDTVNNAPATTNRVFNLDFTDPKTLIIIFLIVMGLAYFLFFKPSPKNAKR